VGYERNPAFLQRYQGHPVLPCLPMTLLAPTFTAVWNHHARWSQEPSFWMVQMSASRPCSPPILAQPPTLWVSSMTLTSNWHERQTFPVFRISPFQLSNLATGNVMSVPTGPYGSSVVWILLPGAAHLPAPSDREHWECSGELTSANSCHLVHILLLAAPGALDQAEPIFLALSP
jgi:hypothetical protein